MVNNLAEKWLHPRRLQYAFVGCALAIIISYFGPRAYLQFIDNTKYISVPNLVTFDRKVYSAGETQTARLTLKIDVDSDIALKSRLMLILLDNQYKVVKQTETESFVVAKADPQTFVIPAKLPCDLEDGQYLYRGEIEYQIKGVTRFTGFETDIFVVDNDRVASDTAQIAKNCAQFDKTEQK